MPDQRGLLDLRTDLHPWRVDQRDDGDVERVAQLQEARGLVRSVAVDGAGKVAGVVRDDPHRAALDPSEGGDHAQAEVAAQFQHTADVEQAVDHCVHVVPPLAVLWDHVAQFALIGALPIVGRTLEVAEVLLGRCHCGGFIRYDDVDHAVGALHLDRADVVRVEDAESAALDHRRAPHADVAVLRGDDHVAAAEHGRIAGEAVAGVDAHEGHQPAELGEVHECEAVEPADSHHVGIARPASAAFGEEHHRQTQRLGQLEQTVLLAMVLPALGASEHRVVVGDRHDRLAVDRAQPADHPVGRRPCDEVVEGPPAALRGDDHRAVLHERAGVDQVGHVLAGCATRHRATLRHRLRPGRVEADIVPRDDFGKIGPDERRVLGSGLLRSGNGDRTGRHSGDNGVFRHGGADVDDQRVDRPVGRRLDRVMHLHRLDHHQLLALADLLADSHVDDDDRALHRRCDVDPFPHARRR